MNGSVRSKKMDENLERILEAHRMGVIQEAIQINAQLIEIGKTWEDVKTWVDKKKTGSAPHITILKRKCPRCGGILNYSKVSYISEKYAQGYRTYFLCGAACCKGDGCGYSDFSKLTIEEWKDKLTKKEGK